MGKQWNQWQTLFGGGALKSLQMVIAAMKLKDAYSLGGEKKTHYDQPRQHIKKQRCYIADKGLCS